jgi:hypothetical protein
MPNFNIHWKGHPRRRLPRIRVASASRASIRSRSVTRAGTQKSLRVLLGGIVVQDRKTGGFGLRFRRRRGRSSRSTSSAVQARRRASQRARQNIQAFGWTASGAELASRVTSERVQSRGSSVTARAGSETPQVQEPSESGIPSTDGAGSSTIRKAITTKQQPKSPYSLMHVAEVPIYWGDQKRPTLHPDKLSIHSRRRTGGEYSHVGPLDPVSRRSTYRSAQTHGHSRTYDSRIDPKSRAQSRTKSTRIQSRPLVAASTVSVKSFIQSVLSEAPSRTRSERKALNQFTKELDLYLKATRSLPRQSLVPSPSVTTVSANTVTEFKPYQSEFQSAGLAVTSAEQRGLDIEKEAPTPPPRPPKEDMFSKRKPSPAKSKSQPDDKQAKLKKQPSYASGSTGTDVIGWTPPHEKSYSRGQAARPPLNASSDVTHVGWTPPERVAPSPPPKIDESPRPPTKKSLPWLRKPESSQISPTQKKMSSTSAKTDRLTGWVATLADVNPPPPPEKDKKIERTESRKSVVAKVYYMANSREAPKRISHRSTEVGFQRLKSSKADTEANDQMDNTKRPLETVSQTDPVPSEQAIDISAYITKYNDIATQTSSLVPRSSRAETEKGTKNEESEEIQSTEPVPTPPTRKTPTPPLPTPSDTQPSPESSAEEPLADPEPEIQHEDSPFPAAEPNHICTARSSLQCQQCLPPQASDPSSPLQDSSSVQCEYGSSSRRSTRPIIPAGPVTYPDETQASTPEQKAVEGNTKEYPDSEERSTQYQAEDTLDMSASQTPVSDPIKRPSLPRVKLRSLPVCEAVPKQTKYFSKTSRTRTQPPAIQRPMVVYAVPITDSSSLTSTSLDSASLQTGEATDKQVFRGLHVATAAACDEDVDKWIEEITGTGIRRFLADLSAFDGLGVNTLANVAKRAAKQRRDQVRAWEFARETRLAGADLLADGEVEEQIEEEPMRCKDSKMEFAAGDPSTSLRKDSGSQQEDLVGKMKRRREFRGSEGVKERAVRMGWRDRSVSGVD